MPKVSIIIRTKNEERWIGNCLDAVFKQKFKDFEVIVVDNESSDHTVKKAKKYPVNVVSIKNFLPGRAINLGVSKSKGEIIVILSGHCIPVNDNWLSNLINDLNDPKVAGVYGRQQPMSFSSDNDKRDLITVFGLDKKIQKKDSFFHNANSAIRKDFLEKFPFDEETTNIEDRIWGMQVIKAKYQIIYEPTASVFHFHGINQNLDPDRSRNVVRILENLDDKVSKDESKFIDPYNPLSLETLVLIPVVGELEMCGKIPLIYYTIKRAIEAKHVNRIIALVDNEKSAKICKELGAEVPFLRPKELSSNISSIQDVLKFGLSKLNERDYFPDICVVLYQNYPFRSPGLIDDFILRFVREGADSMMPMKEEGRAIWKKSNDDIKNINPLMPRKLKKDQFLVSHFGLGFVTRSNFIADGSLGLEQKVYSYPIKDPLSSLEIRDEKTLSYISSFLEKYMRD